MTNEIDTAIEKIMTAAGSAGDTVQVALCAVALGLTEEYAEQIAAELGALAKRGVYPEHDDARLLARVVVLSSIG